MAGKTKKFSLLTPEMEVLQNTSKRDSRSFDLTPEQKKVLQNTSKTMAVDVNLTPEQKKVLQNTSKNDSRSFDLTPEKSIADKIKLRGLLYREQITNEESIPLFIDEITKLSMEEVTLPRNRDIFIKEVIRDKAEILKEEGFPEYDEQFFNNAIKERRREIAEEQDPLLSKRQIRQEGGEIDEQMSMLMESGETHTMPDGTEMPGATHEEYEEAMLPDEEMEDNYLDFILDEALDEEEENYLMEQLESNDKLSLIFDKVIDVATEFAGSGPVDGPGSGVSDSIPARLSDGEFVITAKATEEIGEDNLMAMMKEAEAKADERQNVAYGGMIDEEDQAVPLPTQGSKVALGNVPNVVKQSRQVEEEMLKSSPRRYYVPVSG